MGIFNLQTPQNKNSQANALGQFMLYLKSWRYQVLCGQLPSA